MKLKLTFIAVLILALSAGVFAQEISRDDFRKAEWEMKSRLWQFQQEKQDPSLILDQSDYDVIYWELDIDVTDIQGQIVSGKVTMTSESTVDGLSSIEYDLNYAMDADSVFMYGEPADYIHQGNILDIDLDHAYDAGEQFTTVVYYHGHPVGGGFGSFGWRTHNGQPIISTLSEPEGAREWWPCKDIPHDKGDSADVIITVPDNLVGTSNGVLVSDIDNGDGTRTFHWDISYPITTYLISLAISNYESFTDWYFTVDGDSMPIVNYVYPEHFDNAVEDLSITASAIEIFAGLFGEYPFIREKYGHSIFPWGGAMEHQCNTSYGASLIRGDHAYDWILVHELAHMWFGDMISCDTWPDIWMNEGFASYLEALWTEDLYGHGSYLNYMRYNNGVSEPSGPIYDPNPLFGGNTVYSKGSWALHMLRGVMGDDAFFEGMYDYANHPEYQYGTIQTLQFRDHMEEYYGAPLDWYFEEWLMGRNRPHYVYSWMSEEADNGRHQVFLHIRQTQSNPSPHVFTMPIKVYPQIGGVDTLITVWNDSREDDFSFYVTGQPSILRFDIDDWILKQASSENYSLNIVTTELPNGDPNEQYEAVIEARGGDEPYAFSVSDGELPTGLSLDSESGEISGIPTDAGEFDFTVECVDATDDTDDQAYTLLIGEPTDISGDDARTPSNFALIGNYPNPFNNSTVIKFRLADPADVSLEIFNVLGQRVETLTSETMTAGEHELVWTGDDVPSGIYFYRLTAGEKSAVKKMALIK